MLEATRQASLYIVPVLLTAYALLRTGRALTGLKSAILRFIVLLLAVPLALVKAGPLSITSVVLAISPGYSVASMGLLAVLIVSELRQKPNMHPGDWTIFFGFNIVLGGYLYLSVIGLAAYDAYPLGYGFSWVFVVTALYTLVLIVMRNPLALAYVIAIAAWDYHLLAHSRNFFDYIIDGPLFVFSVIGLVALVVRRTRASRTS